jgi:hypothetical protein
MDLGWEASASEDPSSLPAYVVGQTGARAPVNILYVRSNLGRNGMLGVLVSCLLKQITNNFLCILRQVLVTALQFRDSDFKSMPLATSFYGELS